MSQYNITNVGAEYDYLFKLLIIGDSGAGKSAILHRYTDNAFSDSFVSTIGVDFSINTVTLDGKTIKLQIWDTAGQERFRTITSSYYRGAHGIIIVYDITNRDSFDNIKIWLSECDRYAMDNVPIILIGNKVDLFTRREVNHDDVEEFVEKYNNTNPDNKIQHIETSAKTSINISKCFSTMAQIIKDKQKITPVLTSNDNKFQLTNTESAESKWKCCTIM
jgi:Ras-related protein Rab-1A